MNDFYKLQKITKQHLASFEAQITLNPRADVYRGHFPNQPIAPGVCLVQMVTEIVSAHLDKKLALKTARQIKFLAVVNPNEVPELTLEVTLSESEIGQNFKCTAHFENQKFFKISGELSE